MDETPHPNVILPAIVVSLLLFAGVFWAYQSAKNSTSHIVLPGGITYVGPTPTTGTPDSRKQETEGKIPIPPDTKLVERKGVLFPYSFFYPETLSLGVFPNDPYDGITVFYPGTDANTNIFFRVENLTKLGKRAYIGKPMEYANTWWKDYAWKGVSKVTTFTNKNGLTGYRASYVNDKGETPYDHVFFEVPKRNDLIIWISGKLFAPAVFNQLIDTVKWQ